MTKKMEYQAPEVVEVFTLPLGLSILADASTRSSIDPIEEEDDPNV